MPPAFSQSHPVSLPGVLTKEINRNLDFLILLNNWPWWYSVAMSATDDSVGNVFS